MSPQAIDTHMRQFGRKNVLVLCTGNSCRSIMAEALINHYLGAAWTAFSAGTRPGEVNPYSLQVLRELGISTESLRSKSVGEFLKREDIDLVITVCDNARDSCPIFPGKQSQIHIPIPDPVSRVGLPEQTVLQVFRGVREEIVERVLGYLKSH